MAKSPLKNSTKALPGGTKAGASVGKRSGAGGKNNASGKTMSSDADYGPRTSGNLGAKVGDDGAGTRFTVGLPPETEAMCAPEAVLPATAADLAADALPVPSADQPLIGVVETWDHVRDRKLGNMSKRGNGGGSGANQ